MKLIIENRTELPMAEALRYAIAVVEQGRISNYETEYCYATRFGEDIMVVSNKNKNSDRLVIYRDSSPLTDEQKRSAK